MNKLSRFLIVGLSVLGSLAQAQYFDAETGLHYNGARYYDPKVGRYLSADPVSVGEHAQRKHMRLRDPNRFMINEPPLELNPYPYVANNPMRWIDPTGEDILCGNGFTSSEDPDTHIVKCIPTYQKEPPQCLYGECAHVLPKTTNTQCMIKCMVEGTPVLAKGVCKAARDPVGDIVARKTCEEYAKYMHCSAKCDKEIVDLCPTKK